MTQNKFVKVVLCMLMSFPAVAADMQVEITHLLAYVRNTDCMYERNGKLYSGVKAVEHIQNKYDYFRDDINTTEKFIELSASRSTMSGKAYLIHCSGGRTEQSRDWLLRELQSYRRQQTPGL